MLILYRIKWCACLSQFCQSNVLGCLGMYWQYALNMEEYDIAQQLRNKLTEVGSLIFDPHY